MPRFHRWGNGVSLTSVLNATAVNDAEARRQVKRTFGSLLVVIFGCDVACALASVWITCWQEQDQDDALLLSSSGGSGVAHCMRQQVVQGLNWNHLFSSFGHHHDGHEQQAGLGDLVIMALIRCLVTGLLLWWGIYYGCSYKMEASGEDAVEVQEHQQPSETNHESSGEETELTAPLLSQQTATTNTTATTAEQEANDVASAIEQQARPSSSSSSCGCGANRNTTLTPSRAKNLSLLGLFLTSTLFQIYVGLKVSNFHPPSDHHWHFLLIMLLCLTVLWINVESYLFRTLLSELTRPQGLFLANQVHRHPVFFHKFRQMAMQWCDLCQRRIQSQDGGYRCPLCDFDLCLACSQRTDARTVGEHVLRGDRGVRAETEMTSTSVYFWRSLQVARSELPLLLVSFVLLAASSLSRLFLPHFQGHIIDKVIPDPNTGEFDKSGFRHYIQIYLVLMLAQGALSTLYSAIFTLVSRRLKFTIRNVLFERILIQDVAYFDGTESGRLISRLTNDLDLMMSPIQSSLSSLLSNVLILVGGMVMCFVKSYRLSMLAFVTVGPITYLWEQYAQWSKGLAKEMLSHWAEGNSIAAQALSHIRTVKAFGCEDRVLGKYSEANEQALHCGIKDAWGNGVTSALTGYLDLGSGVLILYFGGLLVYSGELSVGELVTFQLFWNMMNNAYQNLQGLVTQFTRSAAGAEKVFSLWDSTPDINPKEGNDITWDINGRLELRNVSFFYQMRPDHLVLKEFNLDIPAGSTVALVGRSGGGKSTIINLLLRFYDAKEGKILLDGREYPSLKVHQLRRLFGVVTQETELFALSVLENITYGMNPDEYTMEEVINAAKKAHAYDFIMEMKDGFQTRIGERGNRLSGGQRQRLAIARVFIRRPKLILLDEATSALDEHSQEAVQEALSTLIAESNATVVLVAHRLSTVMNADSIVVIDKGVALEQGNHQELVELGGIYASMVEKQNKKKSDQLDQEKQGITGINSSQKKTAVDDIDELLSDRLDSTEEKKPDNSS